MEYATMIMMLVTFLQERQSNKDRNLQGLKDYLEEKNHHQIISYLESDKQAQEGVEKLFSLEFSVLNEKLDVIIESVTSAACRLEGFDGIANNDGKLSEEAIALLKEIKDCENGVIYKETHNSLFVLPDGGEVITSEEPQWLQDDLDDLVKLSWLSKREINADGGMKFSITREGVRAIKALKRKT